MTADTERPARSATSRIVTRRPLPVVALGARLPWGGCGPFACCPDIEPIVDHGQGTFYETHARVLTCWKGPSTFGRRTLHKCRLQLS